MSKPAQRGAGHGGLLVRGSLLRASLLFANVAVAFYLMPFIIHSIGDRWYGMWTLVGTFMGYYGFLDLGLSIATQRYLATALGRDDNEGVNQVFSTSLAIMLFLGLIAILVTGVIAVSAPLFLQHTEEIAVFRIVLLLMALNVGMSFAIAPINGLISGQLRFDIAAYIEFIKLVLRTALIVYFVSAGYTIIALAATTLAVDFVGNALKLNQARRLFDHLRVGRRYVARGRVRELFDYGAKTFVNQIAELMRFQLSNLIAAAFINLSAVTMFNIAGQLVAYFRQLMGALMGVLAPVYGRYQAADNQSGIRKTYYFTSKISALICTLAAGGTVILGRAFIVRWMGEEYVEGYRLLSIMIIPMAFFVAQSPANNLIYGLGSVGPLARFSIIEASANVLLSIVLVRFYNLTGIALGIAIPLTAFGVYMVIAAGRLVGGGLVEYARQVGPVFLWGGAFQFGTAFAVPYFNTSGYLEIALVFLLFYPAQALLVALLAFHSWELRMLWDTGLRAAGLRRVSG